MPAAKLGVYRGRGEGLGHGLILLYQFPIQRKLQSNATNCNGMAGSLERGLCDSGTSLILARSWHCFFDYAWRRQGRGRDRKQPA